MDEARREAWVWGAFLACMILPVGGVAVLATTVAADAEQVVEEANDLWVEVELVDHFDESTTTMALKWGPGASVLAPPWSGTVTAVAAVPGVEVSSGERVAQVDGRWRIAARTETPFYRPLARGDRGPDVVQLNLFLASNGFGNPSGEHFNWRTEQALLAMEKTLGGSADVVFDPADVVWIPTDPFLPNEVDLVVGQVAPGAGEIILEGIAVPTSAALTPAPESREGELVAELGGETLPVSASAPYLSLSDVARLVAPDTTEVQLTLRRTKPIEAWSVPVAAVLQADPRPCLVYRTSPSSVPDVQSVEVVGGTVGQTRIVSAALPERFEVLANPRGIACT